MPFLPGCWSPKRGQLCGQSPRLSPRGPATGPLPSVTWGMAISPSLLEEAPLLKGLIGGKKKVVGQNEAAAASDVKIRMVKSEGLFLRREQQGDSQGSVRTRPRLQPAQRPYSAQPPASAPCPLSVIVARPRILLWGRTPYPRKCFPGCKAQEVSLGR